MSEQSPEQIKAELDRLRAENEALKRASSKGLSLKVSAKGAVSLYGMGRFPVTLYQEQWLKVLGMKEEIIDFIEANKGQLKTKDGGSAAAAEAPAAEQSEVS